MRPERAWAAGLLALAACLPAGQGPEAPEIAPRRALGAAVLEGRVVAAGGWSGAATQLDTVEILSGGRWTAGPPLAVARSQHALVAAGGRVWALGGWSATAGLVSEVEVLDAAGAGWTTVTHLPTPRREPGAALLGGRIIVAGGFDGASDADLDGYRDTAEAYDLATGRWTALARLNVPRRGLALVAGQAQVYAIGGYTAEGEFSAAVERYDPGQDEWTTLAWPITPRTWAAALALEESILIIGGYNRDGFLGLVERVDPVTGAVCRPPPLRRPRAWLAAVVLDGRVLTLGGEEPGGIGGAAEWIETECRP